jgi:tetratricopeptide (TPR) repeat protein
MTTGGPAGGCRPPRRDGSAGFANSARKGIAGADDGGVSLIPDQASDLSPAGATATSVAETAKPAPLGAGPAATADRKPVAGAGASPTATTETDRDPAAGMSPTEVGVARAAALFERVDPAKAAALLDSVLGADPHSAEGWILMSRVLLVLDQADRALQAAGRATALVPDDPRPLAAASRALTLLGRHDEAITTAYRAVIADPKNPLWHDRVAWSLIAADRQLADAEQAARTAIGLNPNEAHYYFTHGVTLDTLGHADQARQALLISLRLEPENPVAQHRLAVLNGESVRPPDRRRRGWWLFGRRSTDGGKPIRPEEFLP